MPKGPGKPTYLKSVAARVGVGDGYLCGDFKTATAADVRSFQKSVVKLGYHSQASFYLEGVTALTGEIDPVFAFIVQETDAPYLVNVIELSSEALLIGAERMQYAVGKYKECKASGNWHGYLGDIALVPTWASIEHDENRSNWGME